MKVRFVKQHLHWNAGNEEDLPEGIAAYLIAVKVATIEDPPDDKAIEKQLTKKLTAKKKK